MIPPADPSLPTSRPPAKEPARAAAPAGLPLAAEGSLADRDVPEILRQVLPRRWSGTLVASHRGVERRLSLQAGKLMSASSTSSEDTLADILLRRGRLTLAQYTEAGAAVTDARPVEAVLVEQGVLDPQTLMRATVEQIHEIVFGAVEWTEGEYRLVADDKPAIDAVAARMKPFDAIIEAIRRVDCWKRVKRGLGGLDSRYARAQGYETLLSQMTARPERLSILARWTADQDVRTACTNAEEMSDFEACRLLWAFRTVGLIRRIDDRAARRPPRPVVDEDGLGMALTAGLLPPEPAVPTRTARAAAAPEPPVDSAPAKRILAVGVPQDLWNRIDPLLKRASLMADRVPRPQSALVLCSQRRFDLVIAMSSFSDMPITDFLAELRSPRSQCARAQILLLADGSGAPLPAQVDGLSILPVQAPAKVLEEIAMRMLGVEPRQTQRLMMRVELHLESGRQLLMCQTENISKLGMLLRSDRAFPVGSRLAFDFTPPGDRTPIRGKAEVVRHTLPDIDGVNGMGVKLVGFQADGQTRWEGFLSKRAS
jgi:hypothetical protein